MALLPMSSRLLWLRCMVDLGLEEGAQRGRAVDAQHSAGFFLAPRVKNDPVYSSPRKRWMNEAAML